VGILVFLLGAGVIGYFFISLGGFSVFFDTDILPADIDFLEIRYASNLSRVMTWERVLELIPNQWLIGYGPETFPIVNSSIEYLANTDNPTIPSILYDPHNIILYHLTATGLLGLVSLLWVIFHFFKLTFFAFSQILDIDNKLTTVAILSSATVYLIQAQVNPDTTILVVIFWFLLGLSAAITRWCTIDQVIL
jgi:O-antigen ligase